MCERNVTVDVTLPGPLREAAETLAAAIADRLSDHPVYSDDDLRIFLGAWYMASGQH